MEAQLQQPSHSHEDGRTHSEVGGEGDEKKSVLKKVKDKAKKIKESIKKHGHGHHHDEEDHHQVRGYGAPTSESTVVRSVTLSNDPSPNTSPPRCEHRSDHHLNSGSTEPGNPQFNAIDQDSIAGKISGASMKEYLCEKLKPGEEDKALSEVITNALQKEEPKRGKVTVSKEVAERLGMEQKNKREGEDAVAAGEDSTGQGVAERLQNAFGSWLGKSNGIETAQDSIAHAFAMPPVDVGPSPVSPTLSDSIGIGFDGGLS